MKNVALLLSLFFIGTVSIFTFRPLGATNALLEQSVYIFAALIATASAFYAFKTYGKGPRSGSLLVILLGFLCWLIADTTFIYFDFIAGTLSYPSPADYFYLLGYILLFSGLMREVILSDISWKTLNKGIYAIAAIFSATLLTLFGFITVFASYSPDVTLAENIVTIGYTVGDILLVIAGFFIILIVWQYKGGKASIVWTSLFLGFLATLIADLIYANFTDEFDKHIGLIYSVSQYFYILGYLCITFGFIYLRSILHKLQEGVIKLKK